MVMANDAVSTANLREDVGWGGVRQKRWMVQGKRAVVHVEPGAYLFLTALARLCRRSNQDMCSQVFAAGMEALTGYTIKELSHREFSGPVSAGNAVVGRVMTHDEVRKIAQMFTLVQQDEPEDDDPEFR